MTNNIQKLFKIAATLVIGSVILWSCEPDADQLGSQFFQNGAQGTEVEFPLIAYTANNNDTIRTDADRLQSATLGAFNEPQFGLQKSAYVTQVRMATYQPDFGTNPVLDSAVLVLKPVLTIPDSATVTTTEDFIYPIGAVPAKKVVTNYPVEKYGKTKIDNKTLFNIKINEVTEFLGANNVQVRSNRNVATGGVIGSKVFDGKVNSIMITKDTDNSTLYQRPTSLRIPMDSTFFQSKIISKATSPDLFDAASFIRYFKGLKISVVENDGYIFKINPNDAVINLYYKKDLIVDNVNTREESVFTLNLGGINTHFNQITFNRAGTSAGIALATPNQEAGEPKIYVQGMGGPGFGLRIPSETVASIKELYKNQKVGIVSAKIRIYTDESSWSNNYKKPDYFVVRQRDLSPPSGSPEYLNTFLTELSALALTGNYNLVKAYDLDKNPAYYDIGITQTFKNIIEKEARNYDLVLNVGVYTSDINGVLIGSANDNLGQQNFTTRAYTPNRAVFVGTDPGNLRSPKLMVKYGQK